MALHSADRAGVASGVGEAAQGSVVGIVDVGIGARGGVAAGSESGVHQLLVGRRLRVTLVVARLVDVQGALGGEGLREVAPAVTWVVADMVAKQASSPLQTRQRGRWRRLLSPPPSLHPSRSLHGSG